MNRRGASPHRARPRPLRAQPICGWNRQQGEHGRVRSPQNVRGRTGSSVERATHGADWAPTSVAEKGRPQTGSARSGMLRRPAHARAASASRARLADGGASRRDAPPVRSPRVGAPQDDDQSFSVDAEFLGDVYLVLARANAAADPLDVSLGQLGSRSHTAIVLPWDISWDISGRSISASPIRRNPCRQAKKPRSRAKRRVTQSNPE